MDTRGRESFLREIGGHNTYLRFLFSFGRFLGAGPGFLGTRSRPRRLPIFLRKKAIGDRLLC